jgi:hypothetical protein
LRRIYGKQKDRGGAYCAAMYGVQAEKLHDLEKPPEHPGKVGIQEVLSL